MLKVEVLKTIKGKQPMQCTNDAVCVDGDEIEANVINVVPDVEYQTIEGFGGAFTEAAAVTWSKLGDENKKEIMKLYFDAEYGAGYNMGRVHMNSCDFALGNYSCVEEGDEALETFNIERDKQAVIPMIKAAMKYGNIDIMVSPWSPPPYMKTNGQMNDGGKLKKEYYELWSQFYVEFIKRYRKEGINVNRITVQNEPKAVQKWDSCVYTAEEEAELVKNHLGEKMKDINVEILCWDHNKERVYDRSKTIIDIAGEYIGGTAFHWYSGDHFEELEMFHKVYPEKKLFFSEGCYEYSLGEKDTVMIGEKYAHDMIGNFNNYCNGFYDWNLLLDERGGPNHVGNFCDAPIMADTKNDKIFIHDSYYYIKHMSAFVKKGAVRIGSSKFTDELDTIAFKNPNGSIVVIVLNRTEKNFESLFFRIKNETVTSSIEAHSIATFIFKSDNN